MINTRALLIAGGLTGMMALGAGSARALSSVPEVPYCENDACLFQTMCTNGYNKSGCDYQAAPNIGQCITYSCDAT